MSDIETSRGRSFLDGLPPPVIEESPPLDARFTLEGWTPPPPIEPPAFFRAIGRAVGGVFDFIGQPSAAITKAGFYAGGAVGGIVGGAALGGAVLFACLAAGPLGWLVGLLLVPLAAMGGYAGGIAAGGIGGAVGIWLLLLTVLVALIRAAGGH
jgi:hypothetical protein